MFIRWWPTLWILYGGYFIDMSEASSYTCKRNVVEQQDFLSHRRFENVNIFIDLTLTKRFSYQMNYKCTLICMFQILRIAMELLQGVS